MIVSIPLLRSHRLVHDLDIGDFTIQMAWRVLTSALVNKFHFPHNNNNTALTSFLLRLNHEHVFGRHHELKVPSTVTVAGFHSCPFLKFNDKVVEEPLQEHSPRRKLKGKRAVVRWLKFFRYKKKKEIQRMTTEETILYKLLKVPYLPSLFPFKLYLSIPDSPAGHSG
jgi:hypothetical protein